MKKLLAALVAFMIIWVVVEAFLVSSNGRRSPAPAVLTQKR